MTYRCIASIFLVTRYGINLIEINCMKTIIFSFVVFLTCTSAVEKSQPASKRFAGNKHALIIAIGAYDYEKTGWTALSSQYDVPLISEALTSQGFPEQNITLLADEDADMAGITQAMTDLENRVGKGDIVVIHYSGHGQQIFDNNGDEADGYDEALVTINAPARYHKIPGYTGEDHLRDEDLGEMISKIRLKVGGEGQVLLILDSCHSGTGTRGGTSKARGGEPPFAPDNYVASPGESAEDEEGYGMEEGETKSRGDASDMGAFILFAAARFDELNYETQDDEGNDVGSLSYSFSKAMIKACLFPANLLDAG